MKEILTKKVGWIGMTIVILITIISMRGMGSRISAA